jgi:TPR repeat protein
MDYDSLRELAYGHFSGIRFPYNETRGFGYLEEMVKARNYSDDVYHLGICYHYGKGVKKDTIFANCLLEEAAARGQVNALQVVGTRLILAGIPYGFDYLRRAAKDGCPDAIYSIACCYMKGIVVKFNPAKAHALIVLLDKTQTIPMLMEKWRNFIEQCNDSKSK